MVQQQFCHRGVNYEAKRQIYRYMSSKIQRYELLPKKLFSFFFSLFFYSQNFKWKMECQNDLTFKDINKSTKTETIQQKG